MICIVINLHVSVIFLVDDCCFGALFKALTTFVFEETALYFMTEFISLIGYAQHRLPICFYKRIHVYLTVTEVMLKGGLIC